MYLVEDRSFEATGGQSDLLKQVGALCVRETPDGPEVLLITTRDSKRWMIPKGWPILGLSSHKTAEREAWEEAGVIGKVKRKLYGHFRYVKVLDDGRGIELVVAVHLLKVQRQKKQFPEMGERNVVWMTPTEAAKCVREPDLKRLLSSVERNKPALEQFG